MESVSMWVAFVAGLLSFFSPCIFPVLPAYLSHLTGGNVQNQQLRVDRSLLLQRSIAFIVGFSIVFMIMGASATFVGQFFQANRKLIEHISGILIVAFGLQMLGVFQLNFLMKDRKWEHKLQKPKNWFSSVLVGVAFGSGWTPCVGLTLSTILLLASASTTVGQGMLLLGVYSLGMALPFLFISFMMTKSVRMIRSINRYLGKFSIVNGSIMILLGLMIFTGQMTKISAYFARFSVFNL
ncbi:cytochrome c biogenesis CcdA family protein [Siminovitchia sp. FSL H7-0308]|uniref:Cytochrome c-type biogenesis protein n=1 Tax=Siminovitchia thermophila TaxID=1245522 RepID=A0ABS2R6I5_9BACI|nr:cytochrome c biogenesis CcdA family protein [Siminovitchia thermophila]MBM7715271.1 cytochrome c-type biogenesis protein [Siminovitchia thermophila]ONK24010.1 cytochrome c biogenesis protein CcdA [Bacillus sp. VT-16-64]